MVKSMPKKKDQGVEDRSGRLSGPVQVYKELARWVGVICQHRNWTQAEFLSPIIREAVEAEYKKVSLEIQREVKDSERGGN